MGEASGAVVKVKKRPDTFEAIQFDPSPEGLKAMQRFLGHGVSVEYLGSELIPALVTGAVETGGCERLVHVGNWLVREGRGGLNIYSPAAFATVFEAA